MKLELKHLASYLPYGLKFRVNLSDVQENYNNELREFTLTTANLDLLLGYGGKPILRPLSDLTKEIDGVVHLVELAKIHNPFREWIIEDGFVKCENNIFEFYFDRDFHAIYASERCAVSNQIDLFEYLFQHHFDVYGLIGKGLAVDINTIENV